MHKACSGFMLLLDELYACSAYLVGGMHAVCKVAHHCGGCRGEHKGKNGAGEEATAERQVQGLTPDCACLVTSMLLRAAYGGMGGDVAMLKGFARLWLHRLPQTRLENP